MVGGFFKVVKLGSSLRDFLGSLLKKKKKNSLKDFLGSLLTKRNIVRSYQYIVFLQELKDGILYGFSVFLRGE